jgi:hypothetical protein
VDYNFFATLRLCEKKIRHGGRERRQAAKKGSLSAAAESQTEPITISLRLCAFARRKSAPADEKGAQSRNDAKSAAAEGG